MKALHGLASLVITLLATTSIAHAHASYIGYSGAPGSHGRCAASCHGSSGGTIQIAGFPAEYTPEQVYTVTISHSGGSAIRQFNGSCRIGTGSANAGVIAANTNTTTYNTSGETNGVHFVTQSHDSGTFFWTAPGQGTGEVTLYIAGLQGSFSGANSTLQLTAAEQVTDVPERVEDPGTCLLLCDNYPEPFATSTTIEYTLPRRSLVLIEVYDLSGKRMESHRSEQAAGPHQYLWDGADYPSGLYFYRIQAGDLSATRKMLRLR